MKEIKAYLRARCIDRVVHALKLAGVQRMSVIHVRDIGSSIDPTEAKISIELVSRYADVVKLEIVCPESLTEGVVSIIQQEGHTGRPGDGIIYIMPVEDAVKIRTGERGVEAIS